MLRTPGSKPRLPSTHMTGMHALLTEKLHQQKSTSWNRGQKSLLQSGGEELFLVPAVAIWKDKDRTTEFGF